MASGLGVFERKCDVDDAVHSLFTRGEICVAVVVGSFRDKFFGLLLERCVEGIDIGLAVCWESNSLTFSLYFLHAYAGNYESGRFWALSI